MLTGFDLVRAAMSVPGVTSPERTVLLVLSVMANEDAQAWPPVLGETGLTTKCVLSERAVQRAVQRLVHLGHLSRRQLRHGVVYTVHPVDTDLTPATQTGVSETGDCETPDIETPDSQSLTPATQAPKLPVTTNTSPKASPSPRGRAKASKLGFHRLPDNWEPEPLSDITQAKVAKWPPGKLADELSDFRGWAANAKDEDGKGRKLNWNLAWANWINRADRDWTPRGNDRKNGAQSGQRVDGFTAALRDVASR